ATILLDIEAWKIRDGCSIITTVDVAESLAPYNIYIMRLIIVLWVCIPEAWNKFNFTHKTGRCVVASLKGSVKTGVLNMVNSSKSGSSHVSPMSKIRPFKAKVPHVSSRRSQNVEKGGNITVSNSYATLDDESEEEVENVFDESANLLNSTKTGANLSTYTVADG
ncbi:hypothetical protein Tco_1264197, partial [Tanacetum coccineum]